MNWLTSLREQLPLLLVLSPLIGLLVTLAAARTERDLVRYLAVSNSFCTLLILGGIAWQFELESTDNMAAIRLAEQEDAKTEGASNSLAAVQNNQDRSRVERLRRQWFAIDGLNLWPTLVLVLLTGIVAWQAESSVGNSPWFIPSVMLFESACLAALTSCDLRAFLMASGLGTIVMSGMIGRWGGPDRRSLAGRFLFAQFCGGLLVMLGFAMLVVAVPWMKMEDSQSIPRVSWNIPSLVFEIEKWTSRNGSAFHYVKEVFPWMLLLLSLGFAVQAGLFPFHSWQLSLLENSPVAIVVLCLTGPLTIGSIGWFRFVVPLAPDRLASFDWLILIASLGAAIWGSLCSLSSGEPRQRAAFIFLSLWGMSLLGCYSFSTVGMSSAWLMQQQLIVAFCGVVLVTNSSNHSDKPTCARVRPFRRDFATRTLMLLLCLPALGLFASGSIVLSELLRESLLLLSFVVLVGGLVCLAMFSLLNRLLSARTHEDRMNNETGSDAHGIHWPLVIVVVVAAVVNLFPSVMLHHCEPEFDRMFRRFEQTSSAKSAS